MKTAQEWQDEWIGSPWVVPATDQIQAIQADAYKSGLLRAAQVCRSMKFDIGPLANVGAGWCADGIEAEAQKGPQ